MGFAHVYWIGGSPCSGKSSISERLAVQFGLDVYHCDEAFGAHVARAVREQQPHLAAVPGIVWDDFWMRPMNEQLASVFEGYAEEFPMILDDLRQHTGPVIAEGTALLPALVADVLPDRARAIWMVPSEAFLRQQYPQRGDWVQGILDQTRDPQQALDNWLTRDALTAQQVQADAKARGLSVWAVDGRESIDALAAQVAVQFGLGAGLSHQN